MIRHNRLRDVFVDFCRRAHLSVSVEKGHGLTRDHSHTRPADVLMTNATPDQQSSGSQLISWEASI